MTRTPRLRTVDELEPDERRQWDEWLATRPESVRTAVFLRPPGMCYRLEGRGHYALVSYGEDFTVRIMHGADSFLPGINVFGVPVTSLEPCGCGRWEAAGKEIAERVAERLRAEGGTDARGAPPRRRRALRARGRATRPKGGRMTDDEIATWLKTMAMFIADRGAREGLPIESVGLVIVRPGGDSKAATFAAVDDDAALHAARRRMAAALTLTAEAFTNDVRVAERARVKGDA